MLEKYLHNYEEYLWSEFKLNLMLFTRVIDPKPTKMDTIWS